MKKILYLANPYGFSKQTKKLLPEFIKIFKDLDIEVYEPFSRTANLVNNKNEWAYEIAEKNLNDLNRQFLHAKTIGFIHPRTNKKMMFDSILPQELEKILKMLRKTHK